MSQTAHQPQTGNLLPDRHPLTHVVRVALSSLQEPLLNFPTVIKEACPVPFFGRAERARMASVGLNPSDKEFLDKGCLLSGHGRRLETLGSLGLADWSAASAEECSTVAQACSGYFDFGSNPYWQWFEPLWAIFEIAGRGTLHDGGACHIDLAPWATERAWNGLTPDEKRALLKCGEETLLTLLSSTQFEVLLLNGTSVIEGFRRATGVNVSECDPVAEWDGPGGTSRCWSVTCTSLGDTARKPPVTILGWNWHLQRAHPGARIWIAAWAARTIKLSIARTRFSGLRA